MKNSDESIIQRRLELQNQIENLMEKCEDKLRERGIDSKGNELAVKKKLYDLWYTLASDNEEKCQKMKNSIK